MKMSGIRNLKQTEETENNRTLADTLRYAERFSDVR